MTAKEEKLDPRLTSEVLTQALPYIQKYAGKTVVIKYGGGAMVNEALKDAVMGDIVLMSAVGIRVVLVHGGGAEITELLEKIGKKTEFVDGLRVTDRETAEAAQMVLAGKVNKSLVDRVHSKGGRAIGLCGLDGGMLRARPADARLGFVGEITEVDTRPIEDLLEKGYIPIVSTVAGDAQGNVYNINADTAAAKIAGALHAQSFIIMTDAPGVLRDKNDPDTLIPVIHVADIPVWENAGVLAGGMIPKVKCCRDAIADGVNRVFILDGTVPHAILIEIFTDAGFGTMFIGGESNG